MTVDLVIRGALVYPGDDPPSVADVAVAGGRIEAVEASLGEIEAAESLDAAELMLTPGFVDMHAHSALRAFDEPLLEPKIAQGFTTELINPDGLAPARSRPTTVGSGRHICAGSKAAARKRGWSTVAEYLDAIAETRPATTLVPLIGHNSVRDAVMGGARRAPTAAELRRMQYEVRLGLEAGARTLSFVLLYLPGAYADTAELVALAEVAAEFGAPLVPHVRNEGRDVLGALGEFVEVARRSGAPLNVSHLRSAAGSTVLSALLPTWGQEGGASATVGRLRTAGDRRRIAQDMERGLPAWENWFGMVGPPERIVVANAAPPNEDAAGRTLAELAAERGVEPAELVFDLLTRSIREGIVPVEEAVARLTARAAERLGLGDRGRIPPGLRADLVLVDREALCGTATYEEPRQYPDGVVAVWVAGRAVWQDGRATSERPGGVVQEARR